MILAVAAAQICAMAAAVAQAPATYPARPLRLVVPFAAGGPADILARAIGVKLTAALGPQVIVDDRPGANGNIAAEFVARAAPDGYTLLIATAGILAVNPSLNSRLPFDVAKDFAPVALAVAITNALIVHPSLPVHSVRDFIRLAKTRPGQLSYASSGTGAASHLSMELFKSTAGIDVLHVPYRGAAPAIVDLIGGHVQAMLIGLPAALPPLKANKVNALAVSSLQRSAVAPELPTIAEAGLPGFEVVNWTGVVAPAGTPPEIITRLNQEIVKALRQRDTREKLASQGFETMVGTPGEFAAYIKTETAKWAKVVARSGARAD